MRVECETSKERNRVERIKNYKLFDFVTSFIKKLMCAFKCYSLLKFEPEIREITHLSFSIKYMLGRN